MATRSARRSGAHAPGPRAALSSGRWPHPAPRRRCRQALDAPAHASATCGSVRARRRARAHLLSIQRSALLATRPPRAASAPARAHHGPRAVGARRAMRAPALPSRSRAPAGRPWLLRAASTPLSGPHRSPSRARGVGRRTPPAPERGAPVRPLRQRRCPVRLFGPRGPRRCPEHALALARPEHRWGRRLIAPRGPDRAHGARRHGGRPVCGATRAPTCSSFSGGRQ